MSHTKEKEVWWTSQCRECAKRFITIIAGVHRFEGGKETLKGHIIYDVDISSGYFEPTSQ